MLNVTQVTDRKDVFDKYNQLLEKARLKPLKKHEETEKGQLYADQAGLYALVQAGYDPHALATIWDRIADTKGKTGSWLSNALGTVKPNERRLKEMTKAAAEYPVECIKITSAENLDKFKKWQSDVIEYSVIGRRELLHGLVRKQQLSPLLLSDVNRIKFSPNGQYILAQDENGISVLSRQPFEQLFRIDAEYPKPAQFMPDSSGIVFYNDKLRVERWNIADQKRIDVKEMRIADGCFQTTLSSNGKLLGCLDTNFNLKVFDVASGEVVYNKKSFFDLSDYQMAVYQWELAVNGFEGGDAGYRLINMAFSPNCRYFVAGFGRWPNDGLHRFVEYSDGYDLQNRQKLSLDDSIKRVLAYGFSFADDDHILGRNQVEDPKTQLLTFPGGSILKEFAFGIGRAEAPTKGNYLLVRPIKNYPLGIVDIDTKQIFKSSDKSVIDIYENQVVSEMRNGQLGLYPIDKAEVESLAVISNSTLGRLASFDFSEDLKWTAMSSRSRGGVWNLEDGKAVLNVIGFDGAYVDSKGIFFGDFPKYQDQERNVAAIDIRSGAVKPGPKIEGRYARQFGPYLLNMVSAKPNQKESDKVYVWKNIKVSVTDVHTMTELWSRVYPKRAPDVWIAHRFESMALIWNLKSDAAKDAIQSDPKMMAEIGNLREKEGDYYIEFLNVRTGEQIGKLLVETGKGSFRLKSIYSKGDWVVASDSENRVLVYSLKSGALKGRMFGGFATISEQSNLICAENEPGKLALYDMNTFEKKEELQFPTALKFIEFSSDGKQLYALTKDQTFYVLQLTVGKQSVAAGR